MLLFVIIFSLVVAIGFGAASAWSDFKGLTISNSYSLGIVVAFAIALLANQFIPAENSLMFSWKSHLISGVGMFFVTYILFAARVMGAGDSKLITAYSFWVGLQGLASFMFFTTVFGGILGVISIAVKKYKPIKNPIKNSWIDKVQKGENAIPYGIAIAAGATIAFYQDGFFNLKNLAMALAGTSG